jgi:hypothetical protein
MFERISQAAERAATGLSRRGFFGWAARGALAVAGALALGGVAGAAERAPGSTCCRLGGKPCPPNHGCVDLGRGRCYCQKVRKP